MPNVTRDEAVRAATKYSVCVNDCRHNAYIAIRYVRSLTKEPPSVDVCREFVRKAYAAGYTAACAKSDFSKIDADIERFTAELASHFPAGGGSGDDSKYADLIAACKQSVEQHEIGRAFLLKMGADTEVDEESPYARQKSALAALGIPTEPTRPI